MAIQPLLLVSSAIGAYTSQAQASDAQKKQESEQNQNPLAALQDKQSSAQAKLSPFGQARASLADIQSQAQALLNLNNPPTLNDFKVAVQGFVQSLGALNKTVNQASTKQNDADNGPGQILAEVRKAVEGPGKNSLLALQKTGIEQQRDGSFSINQKLLEKSFQENRSGTLSALGEVASRVGKVADKQLSGNGSIGQKVSDLSPPVREAAPTRERDNIQARLDVQKNYQQLLASQLAGAGSYAARNAVATYFNVASL